MIGHRIKGLTDVLNVASAHYQRTSKGRQRERKKVQDSDGSEL